MIGDPTTVGIGVGFLALGLDWRIRSKRRRRADLQDRIRRALTDPDLMARRAAAAVAVQQGLSEVAEILLEAIREEKDASVLDAIAEAVARNQWEPSHRPHVLELRLWAERRLADRAERVLLERAARAAREEPPRRQLALPRGDDSPSPPPSAVGAEAARTNGSGPVADPRSRGRGLAQIAADAVRRLRDSRAHTDGQSHRTGRRQ